MPPLSLPKCPATTTSRWTGRWRSSTLRRTTGAHALKIQTYTPDTMTIDLDEREFHISDPNSLWAGTSLYKLYGDAYTPWEWHAADLRARACAGHDSVQHAVR
jgi:hypothetical protein